jgi:type VI secretion system ImpM family protein
MLGIGNHNRAWCWNAVGKHPAAADYINVGAGAPVLDAVADWMTKGYEALQRENRPTREPHSWRFWLRGTRKDHLICGLGRDSSDRIGRPYPLLIVGEGPLKQWERQWPVLPALLARTWGRIERIAAHQYETLQALIDALTQLPSPAADEMICNEGPSSLMAPERLEACRTELHQTGRITIALNDGQGSDPEARALAWHGLLKACCPDIPRAVFLGGNPRHAFLMVVREPLDTADFVRLWSMS